MAKIEIEISVKNPDEVIAKEKGKLIGLVSKLLSKEKRKAKVEEEVYLSLKTELAESLTKKLLEKGVDSVVSIEIIE